MLPAQRKSQRGGLDARKIQCLASPDRLDLDFIDYKDFKHGFQIFIHRE